MRIQLIMPKEKGNIYLIVIIAVIIIILIILAYFQISGSRIKDKNSPKSAAQTTGSLSLPASQFFRNGSSSGSGFSPAASFTPLPSAAPTNNPTPASSPPQVTPSAAPLAMDTSWGVDEECNPGEGTSCPCDPKTDVAYISHSDYNEVISNPNHKNIWANAIGRQKLPVLPGNLPIQPVKLQYSGQFQIPTTPSPTVSQTTNAQTDQFMIQMYDGKNQFGWGGKATMEAALYWQLNPWVTDTYGHFFVYTPNYTLVDTGINIPPDNNWHSFKIVADFASKKWVSVTVDGKTVDVSNQPLQIIPHPEWDNTQMVATTVEAEPAWPSATCTYNFSWNIYFKNTNLQVVQ